VNSSKKIPLMIARHEHHGSTKPGAPAEFQNIVPARIALYRQNCAGHEHAGDEKLRLFIFVPFRNLPASRCLTCAERLARRSSKKQAPGWWRAGPDFADQSAQNGGIMGSMKKWMLGAALATGALAMTAAPAQAARIGVYVGASAVPACPGPGYIWVAGYWNDGYWVPGYWNFAGVGGPFIRGGIFVGRGPVVYHRDFDRHFAPARFHR
jgi:hypothetical protein